MPQPNCQRPDDDKLRVAQTVTQPARWISERPMYCNRIGRGHSLPTSAAYEVFVLVDVSTVRRHSLFDVVT